MARFSRQLCLLAAALVFSGLAASAGRSDPGPVFSGQATALSGSVAGLTTLGPFGDTGMQNGSSFSAHAHLASVSVTPVTADVLHASTIAGGDQVNSEASLADVSVSELGLSLSADFLMARANATCTASGPTVSASSELVALTLNGNPVTVTGLPSQTISIDGVSILINHQSQSPPGGSSAWIDVTALEVILPDNTDLVFSSAHAGVTACPPGGQPPQTPICPDKDFTTGGGFIDADGKGHFAIAAGKTYGWGHTHYRDNSLVVDADTVLDYVANHDGSRSWDGDATVNGQKQHYVVKAFDGGEPGIGKDYFELDVPALGKSVFGTLAGGNIQLHCKQ
jgi:hypothetical protein